MGVLSLADPVSRPLAAAGSPAGDCLAGLEAVTAGLRCRFGGVLAAVTAHEVAAHLTAGLRPGRVRMSASAGGSVSASAGWCAADPVQRGGVDDRHAAMPGGD